MHGSSFMWNYWKCQIIIWYSRSLLFMPSSFMDSHIPKFSERNSCSYIHNVCIFWLWRIETSQGNDTCISTPQHLGLSVTCRIDHYNQYISWVTARVLQRANNYSNIKCEIPHIATNLENFSFWNKASGAHQWTSCSTLNHWRALINSSKQWSGHVVQSILVIIFHKKKKQCKWGI